MKLSSSSPCCYRPFHNESDVGHTFNGGSSSNSISPLYEDGLIERQAQQESAVDGINILLTPAPIIIRA